MVCTTGIMMDDKGFEGATVAGLLLELGKDAFRSTLNNLPIFAEHCRRWKRPSVFSTLFG